MRKRATQELLNGLDRVCERHGIDSFLFIGKSEEDLISWCSMLVDEASDELEMIRQQERGLDDKSDITTRVDNVIDCMEGHARELEREGARHCYGHGIMMIKLLQERLQNCVVLPLNPDPEELK